MYINKKIEIRGSFPHLASEFFNNNANKNENIGLNNSLSMGNICALLQSNRRFGKEMKNLSNLTVNPSFLINENIEEKIKYYRKINDDLTNMLNNYDKNFYEKKDKYLKVESHKNKKGEKTNNEKNTLRNSKYEESKKCKKIRIENKENKDNNISYYENLNGEKDEKLLKRIRDIPLEKALNLNVNNKDNNEAFNDKNNNENKNTINNKKIKDKNKNFDKEKKTLTQKSTNKDNFMNNNVSTTNLKLKESIKSFKNINNPQQVDEYFDDIFDDMQLRENSSLINPNYLKNTQKFINRKMRSILIDWLIDVHRKYKLKPETIYLTVNIIDRYLSKKNVETINLQLVGVVSLLISSKYEDIYPPKVRDLAEITDGAYVPNQLLSMEEKILSALNFDLFYPTQWHFFECYRKKLNLNKITFFFAWYLMELTLIDIGIINYKGSIIASSAVLLAMKYFKNFNETEFEKVTGFSEKFLENSVNDIKSLWINNKNEKNLSAVRRKFSNSKYLEVSKIKNEF